jgi:hypothetical protein
MNDGEKGYGIIQSKLQGTIKNHSRQLCFQVNQRKIDNKMTKSDGTK